MTGTPKGPLILEVDETPLPDAPSPAEAPPAEPAAERALRLAAGRPGWGLGRMALWLIGALVVLALGVAVQGLVEDLFAIAGPLGWLAIALTAALVAVLLAIAVREAAGLARLARVEGLRTRAEQALATASAREADTVLAGLRKLYAPRADMEWALARLAAAEGDSPDPAGRLAVAERVLMAPLDRRAEDAVRRAARDVAAATALIPMPLVDVVATLSLNLRMVRRIAEVYGGRAGWLGSWRLVRAVAAHLVATGAIAVVDDLLGPMVGGGVLARLSRRFGEGAVNGALTARVGVAAIEVCRPLPFREIPRPSGSGIVLAALKGWRRAEGTENAAESPAQDAPKDTRQDTRK